MKLIDALRAIARFEQKLKARYSELVTWRAYDYVSPQDEYIYNRQRLALYEIQSRLYGDLLREIRDALLYVGLRELARQIPVPQPFPKLPTVEQAREIVRQHGSQPSLSGLGAAPAIVVGGVAISSWAVLVLAIAAVVAIATVVSASVWLVASLEKLESNERMLDQFWSMRRRVINDCLNRRLRARDCANLAQQITSPRDALPEDSMFNWEPTSIAKWGLVALAVLGVAAMTPGILSAIVGARSGSGYATFGRDGSESSAGRSSNTPLVVAGVAGAALLGVLFLTRSSSSASASTSLAVPSSVPPEFSAAPELAQ